LPRTLLHYYDDNALVTGNITVHVLDEDGMHLAGTLVHSVLNVAPTATPFNLGPAVEGSPSAAMLLAPYDPSAADTQAGFRYGFDFNNDGDFTDPGEIAPTASSTSNSAIVPTMYVQAPTSTVRMVICDKDGGETSYTTDIMVTNVAPVVDAGPDATALMGVPFSQIGSFTDPGSETWTVRIWYGDNSKVPNVDPADETYSVTNHNFTLNHSYASMGSYTVTVKVDDGHSGVGTDTVNMTVQENTFRVASFTPNASGFDVAFNRSANTILLNLYNGPLTPAALPDVTVTLGGNPVHGSLVWNAGSNTASWVMSGGVLAVGTYTVTLRSASDGWKDLSGSLLDGNSDYVPGGDFTTAFTVAASTDRVVSLPDFARGATATNSQPVNISSSGTGLPIHVDDASGVNAVDIDVVYDPALLHISGASLAPGIPNDWSLLTNASTPGRFRITMGGWLPLTSGSKDLVSLTADVPAGTPYGAAEVIRLENLAINGGLISAKVDRAVHKAIFFGDADGNGFYSGSDAGLIQRVVIGSDGPNSGFDAFPMTDPVVVADVNATGRIDGLDAAWVTQKSLLPRLRPEIPDIVPGLIVVNPGPDPTLAIDANIPAVRGSTVVVPLKVTDSAAGLYGFNVNVDYNTAVLDLADGLNSPDVSLGSLFAAAGGWTLTSYIDDASGHAGLSFFRSERMTGGTGPIANLGFYVKQTAPAGATVLDVSGAPYDQQPPLQFTYVDGSLQIPGAATRTWDGGGTDNHWTTPENWVGDQAPGSGDALVFPAGAARPINSNDCGPGTAFESIVLSGSGYSLSDNPLVLSGGLSSTASPAAQNVISADLTFTAATATIENAGTTILRGAIASNGTVKVLGTGMLIISGPQSWGPDAVLQIGGAGGSSPFGGNQSAAPQTLEQAGISPDSASAAGKALSAEPTLLLANAASPPAETMLKDQPAVATKSVTTLASPLVSVANMPIASLNQASLPIAMNLIAVATPEDAAATESSAAAAAALVKADDSSRDTALAAVSVPSASGKVPAPPVETVSPKAVDAVLEGVAGPQLLDARIWSAELAYLRELERITSQRPAENKDNSIQAAVEAILATYRA